MTTTRDAFETQATKYDMDLNRFKDCYSDRNTNYGWIFWQAATKAEREACAQVCTKRNLGDGSREDQEAVNCANAIKRRGDA